MQARNLLIILCMSLIMPTMSFTAGKGKPKKHHHRVAKKRPSAKGSIKKGRVTSRKPSVKAKPSSVKRVSSKGKGGRVTSVKPKPTRRPRTAPVKRRVVKPVKRKLAPQPAPTPMPAPAEGEPEGVVPAAPPISTPVAPKPVVKPAKPIAPVIPAVPAVPAIPAAPPMPAPAEGEPEGVVPAAPPMEGEPEGVPAAPAFTPPTAPPISAPAAPTAPAISVPPAPAAPVAGGAGAAGGLSLMEQIRAGKALKPTAKPAGGVVAPAVEQPIKMPGGITIMPGTAEYERLKALQGTKKEEAEEAEYNWD